MGKHSQVIAATAVVFLALSVAAPAADLPYISGGVGFDEREELLAKEKEYNLKVIVAEKSGDYLADVKVVIESGKKERVFDTTMEGPILLVKLPPGTYTIKATSGRETLTETVTVPAQGLRHAMFRWDNSLKSSLSRQQ